MAESDHESNYFYDANIPAAAIFAAIFGLLLAGHILQASRYKTLFMLPLVIACTMETLGYITRIVTIKNPDPLWIIIVSETTLITAPAFLAAQDYMIVGRMMSYVGPGYSFMRHNWITKLFVALDVLAILTQASGGATLAGSDSIDAMKRARLILIGGLCLQVVVFGIFFFIAAHFDWRCRRRIDKETLSPLRPLFNAFYVSAFFITLRSIYRTAEFASVKFTFGEDDPQGYAVTHEWCLYVFDSLPILLSVFVFVIYHPGKFLPRKKGTRIDGTFEEQKKTPWFRLSHRNNKESPRGVSEQQLA